MAEFRMPSLGADMEAGTLVEWLKRPGDRVKRGDVVAVVETQKGAIEVDIFEDGVIERWLVEPGTTVPVGTPLALIGDGRAVGRTPEIAAAATVPAPAAPPRPVKQPAVPLPLEPEHRARRPHASPAARRLAAERGIALDTLTGSGPEGRSFARMSSARQLRWRSVRPRQSASTSPRCAARLLRRWRARSGRSRITI